MDHPFVVWVKDVFERAASSFVQGALAVFLVAGVSDLDLNLAEACATAGFVAACSALKTAAFPKAGFGLPPILDVIARASFTGVFAGASVVAASAGFDLFSISAWEAVGVAAAAAAFAAVKGWIALRYVPEATVTPASFAKAA